MNTRAHAPAVPTQVPAGATPNGDGIALGQGNVTVEAYIDFLCPFCRMFEERAGSTLDRLVDSDVITLVYHPMAFLDRLSTNQYSSRAASSSGCAADGGKFREYAKVLFANQPEEGGPGHTDEELVRLGQSIGLGDDFARCVFQEAYLPWVAYVTELAVERGVSGTPSVFVEGAPVPANAATIVGAVELALSNAR
jgi:protein-disulfide isomerase